GCRNRADRFTGGMVTVLAHYRLKSYLRIGCRIFHFIKSAQGALIPEETIKFVLLGIVLRKSILGGVIPIYSQPVHVPGLPYFVLPYHRYVVFGVASDHTGAATGTGI